MSITSICPDSRKDQFEFSHSYRMYIASLCSIGASSPNGSHDPPGDLFLLVQAGEESIHAFFKCRNVIVCWRLWEGFDEHQLVVLVHVDSDRPYTVQETLAEISDGKKADQWPSHVTYLPRACHGRTWEETREFWGMKYLSSNVVNKPLGGDGRDILVGALQLR